MQKDNNMKLFYLLRNRINIIFVLLTVISSLFFASNVFAKKTVADAESILNSVSGETGVDTRDLPTQIGSIIEGALVIVGLAFFILMFYAGFLWMTARGEEDQVEKAKKTIIAAVIGLVVVVSAYGITYFITSKMI